MICVWAGVQRPRFSSSIVNKQLLHYIILYYIYGFVFASLVIVREDKQKLREEEEGVTSE